MQCNVGTTDKVIRAIIGLAIMAAGYYYQSWWGIIGIIPLLTAVFGWCPLYVPLGISSCKK
ncbi:DUF2892 domain-containing protein [Shewanella yunxiaonensis]|uniref:DUF2892 domain-containing protein n=1 Tax=Shewanella yunxiaonensis TaxID=2829809 RepID=A0ABX7YXC2_9GAMM|nr:MULTISPECIES: DUF2892 domain-containing protein [Shewanella]MDF0534336.1 DUF2892 domain-containing protein [Shewanella sp. A32]QUN07118.1 DUF2892 domain-containing protein [Shewanella yunxiaonensis]